MAGSQTLIGGSIHRQLEQQGFTEVSSEPKEDFSLTNANDVDTLFTQATPEYVFLAAGQSGGIGANQTFPATLMLDNLLTISNAIDSAHRHGVKKLIYTASSCCYPRDCRQPMTVDSLFTGPVEATNAAYATAKLAGIRLCEAYRSQHDAEFISVIPANEFGPGDDFSPEESHVIPALIRKFHEGKVSGSAAVQIWGTGKPEREFIYSEDLADACIFLMQEYAGPGPVNIGLGTPLSIKKLAETVQQVVGYQGELVFDTSRPDGMPVKSLDSSELHAMGWRPATSLEDALSATYAWFLQNVAQSESTPDLIR